MGVVVRDHEGRVLAAFSKMLHYLLGPLEVEVKALKEAVDFAWDVGIWYAHFECDSLLLSDVVRGVSNPSIAISNIVTGICHKLEAFGTMQMSHVEWRGYKPTHILAQYAKGIGNC